ncbi:hypothetical protein WN51_02595 [Melipona quadrifasciata]|uniref:Uncharacterized protein n=1 Tax=Melipona quadrifasciata TaxID=166423 RepID=A0A0M8ZVS2_9HYME|nr:hypothetical protein WN51_02595 [Melipona quadrifasciata]
MKFNLIMKFNLTHYAVCMGIINAYSCMIILNHEKSEASQNEPRVMLVVTTKLRGKSMLFLFEVVMKDHVVGSVVDDIGTSAE